MTEVGLKPMKILVLNGSPKGQYSTTLHTCLYLERRFPEHNYRILDVGKGIRSIEKDFSEAETDLLCGRICFALDNAYTPPQNFLGVGGMKIFRDLIYKMRGLMRADHKFFKSHGQYDFPQKEWKTSMLMYPVGWMMNNQKIRRKMGSKINEGMIKDYRKVVENAGNDTL